MPDGVADRMETKNAGVTRGSRHVSNYRRHGLASRFLLIAQK
jgi:hypothetical protein